MKDCSPIKSFFSFALAESFDDFLEYQRVQLLYILRHYLTPDQNNGTHPTLRTYILCGDGRLFTAFRQEMALGNLLLQPYPRFSTFTEPGFNALKHGNGFFFEAIGDDVLKLHEILTLTDARGIQDEQKVPTDDALFMPKNEMKSWFRNPTGPCTLSYFLENQDRLAGAVVSSASAYQNLISRLLRTEWNPYLAGMKDKFSSSKSISSFRIIYLCLSVSIDSLKSLLCSRISRNSSSM